MPGPSDKGVEKNRPWKITRPTQLITEFIKEVSPLLPNLCHLQDYDRSIFPRSAWFRRMPPEDVRRAQPRLCSLVACQSGERGVGAIVLSLASLTRSHSAAGCGAHGGRVGNTGALRS